jgi:threonyl-tRNA synthetase
MWEIAEKSLEEAAQANELPYKRVEGEAAFYGPKLDFMFKDAIGREWQLATIQCDFNLPVRFDLGFVNEQGEMERPVVIHRAISGSLERFLGIMIEHFAGAFPLWLAPRQMVIVPVAEVFNDYGREVLHILRKAGFRVELDDTNDSLGKKVRNAEQDKLNYALVIGETEMQSRSVAVRNIRSKEQVVMTLEEFVKLASEEMKERKL